MITLLDLSIENYRSIIGPPLSINLKKYSAFVGPNNCGKSNIIRALSLFFNGTADFGAYNSEIDLPKVLDKKGIQTKVTVTVSYDPKKESYIENAIKELEKESGQQRLKSNMLRLRLSFTRSNEEKWQFIGGAGARSVKSDLIDRVVKSLRSAVRFKYLPVGRDISGLIRDELSEELIKTIFNGWSGSGIARKKINTTISAMIDSLQPPISSSEISISKSMASVFSEIKKVNLKLPFYDLESLMPSLIPVISDAYATEITSKGAGIQTSSLLFFLKFLADNHPQRHNSRITYIWAIEEPESYLHPSKQHELSSVLKQFSDEVQTIVTTHCPHFVPRESESCYVIGKEASAPFSTVVEGNTYEIARASLGASLLDSMYLAELNIVVEGPSDKILMEGVWRFLYKKKLIELNPDRVQVIAANNASSACTLFESLRSMTSQDKNVKVVLLIDGDEAGKKALNGLKARQSHIGKPIHPNADYFQLEKTIDWMLSGRVMDELAKERPAQVQITINISDEITDFHFTEGHKQGVARRALEISDADDLTDFSSLIKKMEILIEGVELKLV